MTDLAASSRALLQKIRKGWRDCDNAVCWATTLTSADIGELYQMLQVTLQPNKLLGSVQTQLGELQASVEK